MPEPIVRYRLKKYACGDNFMRNPGIFEQSLVSSGKSTQATAISAIPATARWQLWWWASPLARLRYGWLYPGRAQYRSSPFAPHWRSRLSGHSTRQYRRLPAHPHRQRCSRQLGDGPASEHQHAQRPALRLRAEASICKDRAAQIARRQLDEKSEHRHQIVRLTASEEQATL